MTRRRLSSTYTCVDGRQMRHDPQTDDPDLQTDVGPCPDCDGDGCDPEATIPRRKPTSRTRFLDNMMAQHAMRMEADLRAMLGMWVSELTPVMVMEHGHLIGLTAEEMSDVGIKPHIIIPVGAVQ